MSKQVDKSRRQALCLLSCQRAREGDGHTTQTALCTMTSHSYGPSIREVPSFFDAPKLVPGQDRKRWRRDVLEWVDFTKERAESGEKTAKANVRTMGYLLYQALHDDYKSVLNHARDSGQLVLRGGIDQDSAVKTIIALVGEDTPIDVTNRILTCVPEASRMCASPRMRHLPSSPTVSED